MTGSTVTAVVSASRTTFYPLVVVDVEALTDDSAAITFAVPGELAQAFAFAPGQSLTLRRGDERRSYSICSPAGTAPRIGVREVAGGAVSGWLVRDVRPGDVIEAQVPSGTFTPDLSVAASHVLIAAGSGITPMMSIAASVLAANPASTVTLLYGNRRSGTVMFADEVADLKDAYPARMRIVHVLSREPQEVELHSGRLDRDRLARLLPATVSVPDVDHWWLCGPFGMVTDAMELLRSLGVPGSRLHRELFWVGDEPPVEATHAEAPTACGATVTAILDGRASTFTLPPGTPVLDGAQQIRPDLPFACKGGVCGTCRARVVSGSAVMRRNYALEDSEVSAGYVLTCQALPSSDEITVDYDA
ncbi:phenylacetate-CoA oxygenase/reductase subunit PaaK [Trebonia kvetii]|uniref:Phenylacetate-CoA oxygenase/reductase subunit PaaK n=1 Tax=Trebonia kvetii TaxID=2480626 RepID=A0A6P2C8V9_9ACTN|nr:1,2-phenylacetyl-CoA epoxidase subunit PaaE [Trebonia kvetii]TVZ06786.1 phenylacetate-CoA oxygenase/reductase subunit PaaK [Trebonia kvetii]